MIQRFSFGHPFPAQSVVLSLPAESGPVPFLTPDDSGWQLVGERAFLDRVPRTSA